MSARRTLAAALAATLAASAIALSAGPASAAVDPDDTTFTPVAADLVGVGSDTSQKVVKDLADAWNAATPAPAFKIASYAATGGGTIPIPNGDIARPNGSTNGKNALYGGSNDPDVDFARSSSANNSAQTGAGLQAFPFALDSLVMAVSKGVASNAPASITPQEIVGIYKGTITNWSQLSVPGPNATIAPKIPQAGSGTRSFFTEQLTLINGGPVTIDTTKVVEVQEHDDTTIKSDPNALAPFSLARANLLPTTVRQMSGWKPDRAMYNVVRGEDLNDPEVQAVFGENGFMCSAAAKPLIEAQGFEQLATPAKGGVCGAATQAATTNFKTTAQVVTGTSLAATSPTASSVKLVATVSGKTAPSGTYDFYEGATKLKASVPLVSSTGTLTLTGVAAGAHTYRAVFVPAEGFTASEASATVTVSSVSAPTKAKVTLGESFPAKVKLGKKAKTATVKGTVSVKGGAAATGKVLVKKGKKTLASGTLKAGKAKVALKKLKPGTYKLTISYAGDATHEASTKKFTVKVTKPKVKKR